MLGIKAGAAHTLYKPVGCPQCEHTGYKGRMSILELLKFDAGLDELITQRSSIKVLTEYARSTGFTSMAEDGLRRVRDGLTTVEEVGRVVDLTELIK